jgi:hypothetical protein
MLRTPVALLEALHVAPRRATSKESDDVERDASPTAGNETKVGLQVEQVRSEHGNLLMCGATKRLTFNH